MGRYGSLAFSLLFATLPATVNYALNSYSFGSGGVTNSNTSSYSLEGSSGEVTGQTGSTSNYSTLPGFIQTQQANVPQLSDLDNDGGTYYNMLHFVIDTQGNPSDATYLLSVSTDNFVSNISYLQPDGTLSSSLSTADYQTDSAWGGSSGSLIVGLTAGTTYYVRVRATQGRFSESAYGPVSSQATANPSLTFSLVTSSQSSPPYSIGFGTLYAGSVSTSSQTINTSLSTNGTDGGNVYIEGENGGLLSSSTGYKISSVSNDLNSISEGFGAQNTSIGQTSGGPYSVVSPYNGTGNVVGDIGVVASSLYTSTTPLVGGTGQLVLKAKAAATDTAANDYQEVLTFNAAGNF
jgi:hypothetical protein